MARNCSRAMGRALSEHDDFRTNRLPLVQITMVPRRIDSSNSNHRSLVTTNGPLVYPHRLVVFSGFRCRAQLYLCLCCKSRYCLGPLPVANDLGRKALVGSRAAEWVRAAGRNRARATLAVLFFAWGEHSSLKHFVLITISALIGCGMTFYWYTEASRMLMPGFFLTRLFFHDEHGFLKGFSNMGGESLLIPIMAFNAVFYAGTTYIILWLLTRKNQMK